MRPEGLKATAALRSTFFVGGGRGGGGRGWVVRESGKNNEIKQHKRHLTRHPNEKNYFLHAVVQRVTTANSGQEQRVVVRFLVAAAVRVAHELELSVPHVELELRALRHFGQRVLRFDVVVVTNIAVFAVIIAVLRRLGRRRQQRHGQHDDVRAAAAAETAATAAAHHLRSANRRATAVVHRRPFTPDSPTHRSHFITHLSHDITVKSVIALYCERARYLKTEPITITARASPSTN